jgi:hypothetical protein
MPRYSRQRGAAPRRHHLVSPGDIISECPGDFVGIRNRLRSKRGPKKAICAVAASMLTAIYHMLKDGTFHQDLGADHFDRRSTEVKAKRLVAQLTKLGFQVELQPLAQAA